MPALHTRPCHGVRVIDARDPKGNTVTIEMKPSREGEWQVWGWQQPPLIVPYRADWSEEPRFREHKHGAVDTD